MIVAGPRVSSVRFKDEHKKRLKNEWTKLHKKNPALYSIISYLAGYSSIVIQKDLIVTQIYRTEGEQKAIYGQKTTKKSPHQFYCAVDLRCKPPYHTKEERETLAQALKMYDQFNKHKPMPSGSRTVWIHTVGTGALHFHIQFWGQKKQMPSYFQLLAKNRSNLA